MLNVLITGGAGFIGSSIAKYHLQKGDNVWVVDNLLSGQLKNILDFQNHPSFRFANADLTTWPDLLDAVAWSDRIYHMAAVIGQKLVLTHPAEVISGNIEGCELILQYIVQSKKNTRLLIASTSGVYGYNKNDQRQVFKEDDYLAFPSEEYVQLTYPVSKMVNEIMALTYVNTKNVACCIPRIFNVIGINQTGRYGMVVPTFIEQAIKGLPITVYGDGTQSRSFCNINDTIKAFDLLLEKKIFGKIVNVGNDEEISMNDLAVLIRKLADSHSEIVHIDYIKAYGVDFQETLRRKPCLEKLKALTGFRPSISLENSLREMIALAKAKIN